jgi:hypothetical protein
MRISGYTPGCGNCHSADTPSVQRAQVQGQGREATRAELSLTTAEGDKVTLSFSTASSYQYSGDYGSQAGLRRAAAARSNSATVEVTVEGNLSGQELAEIQKLAKIVTGAAGSAQRGDIEQAAGRMEQAKSLETIQNFAFSLNRTVERAYTLEAVQEQLR